MDIIKVKKIKKVPGLYYIDDIKEDTDNIITELDKLTWTPLSKNTNSRLVQHYGYKYNYVTYKINEKCEELPEFLHKYQNLLTDICLQLNIIDDKYIFNQCIINNYYEGQGISQHIDVKSYGNVIGSITIGSNAKMVFKKDDEKYEVIVKPNSLYIMSCDARYLWTHSMPNLKKDSTKRRISLTFRNVPIK
jgi:alkylated DNA repair dioxygenase AlkB